MPEPAAAPERPSPESLLQEAAAEQRGHLRVFLGAAPGVGKTYAMLEAAQRRKAEGVDVVVGVVETHGRQETDRLTAGLEILPRRKVDYRGRSLAEFDLDAALERRPTLLLVDELAHTNAPESRHPKRHQDVDELLAAGIDVYTTLNVQHLESLNDVVAQITGVRVRETIPDSVLERADEVELIDLPPQDLIQRLREGKVYVPELAERAIQSYFQPGNLTALRELALRRTAERVDEQMVQYMQRHAIAGPWPAGERILVCVGPDTDAVALVRAGRRLAEQLHAPWTAAYVQMPGHYRLADDARTYISNALRLAEQFHGEAVTLPARDLVEELLRYARRHNVTQIVIGRRPTGWLRRVLGRSLVEALLRQSEDISVHVVPLAGTRTMWSLDRFMPPLEWRRYGWSALYVAIAAAAGVVFEQVMAFPSPQPFFFVAVLVAAVRHGFAASILASLLSFGAYNWFFINPRYTFSVAQPHEVVGLILFLFAAVLVSGLAARSRDQAEDARRRMRTQAALYDFSRKLATITLLDDILWATAYQLASAVRGKAVILLPEEDDLKLAGSYPPGEELDTGDITAARWAWEHGETAGYGSSTLPTRPWRFEPMTTSRGTIGVVGLGSDEGRLELEPDTARAVAALIDQSAVAFERSRLANEMAEARIVAATEKLRHALLSSISHDLRTPLAAIIGAVTSLKSFGDRYDANTRTDLLLTIEEEAQRLNGFVANLLDMTRLEAGMLAPKRDWVAVDDLLASAVQRARRHIGRHPISIKPHSELPLCRLDFVLFEQVLFNLIDNAAKYSPVGSPIELEARQDADQVLIEVTDHGSGIPARDLERVFDKFYRIGVTDRRPAGTGLGLAICRGIVEAHGGTIRAISPGPAGDGTVIAVRLPVTAAPDMGQAE